MQYRSFTFAITLVTLVARGGFAQTPTVALDGPGARFHDKLLDKLQGAWTFKGTVAGQRAQYAVTGGWVLGHKFLRLHKKEIPAKGKKGPPYEALVFIGYDHMSERYVAHWIDVFGGRASETLGFAKRSPNKIAFVFEYPTGPFHTTFRWSAKQRTWFLLMRTKNKKGKWVDFGKGKLRRLVKN